MPSMMQRSRLATVLFSARNLAADYMSTMTSKCHPAEDKKQKEPRKTAGHNDRSARSIKQEDHQTQCEVGGGLALGIFTNTRARQWQGRANISGHLRLYRVYEKPS